MTPPLRAAAEALLALDDMLRTGWGCGHDPVPQDDKCLHRQYHTLRSALTASAASPPSESFSYSPHTGRSDVHLRDEYVALPRATFDALTRRLEAARTAALEEAAKACEALYSKSAMGDPWREASRMCGIAIRALPRPSPAGPGSEAT